MRTNTNRFQELFQKEEQSLLHLNKKAYNAMININNNIKIMKWYLLVIMSLCSLSGYTQVVENPVFDRTDTPSFRVNKVEITDDTTYFYCIFQAEEHSWANISGNTYIIDNISNKKSTLLRCEGLPYSPEKKEFTYSTSLNVKLCFPAINQKTTNIDLIENEVGKAFNIYGINLHESNDESAYIYTIERALALSNQADFFYSSGNYTKAIDLWEDIVDKIKSYWGKRSAEYSNFILNLAWTYAKIGNYSKAIELGELYLLNCAVIYGKESEEYGFCLQSLESFNYSKGDYHKAEYYGRLNVALATNVYGKNHPKYALAISDLSQDIFAQGNYNKSKELNQEALEIRRKVLGNTHIDYAQSLHNIALDYAALGDLPKAILLLSEALTIKKTLLGEFDASYIGSLNNLAELYSQKNDFATAKNLEKEVVELSGVVYGTNHPEYAKYVENLSNYYLQIGNKSEAQKYQETANSIYSKELNENRLTHGIHLNNISMQYYYSGNIQKAIMTGKEALDYLSIESPYYSITLSNIAKSYSQINDYHNAIIYLRQALDAIKELMKKEYFTFNLESKYLFWQANNTLFNDVYPSFVEHEKNKENLSDLYNQVLFSKGITCRKDDFNQLTWVDIQQKLNIDDVAIEFISPCNASIDTIYYYALVIKKDFECPLMIKLFHSEQLNDSLRCAISNFDKNLKVGHLVWGPLKEQLNNVKNIYFSASHVLHALPIEYLPINGKDNYSDRYSMYRLSSTAEMVRTPPLNIYRKAVIYGGLDYEEGDKAFNSNSNKQRSGYEPLFETEPEMFEIASIFQDKGINYMKLQGSAGTEESFVSLSGKPIDIIHIATHGVLIGRAEVEINKDADFYSSFYQSDALSCSFLVLSGGNKGIKQISSQTSNDGIVTALEISNMDLSQVNLVSLSACYSGSGSFGADDGLLGLHRGFKLAGAHTILMSLNKVDDEATKILMVEFYKNLMNGNTKLKSLMKAQKHLRIVENGKYDNIKYWGAFVLLDGLN